MSKLAMDPIFETIALHHHFDQLICLRKDLHNCNRKYKKLFFITV